MPAQHGGRRQGKPGVAYGNRTDLNAQKIQTVPGQTYGKATAQAEAQKAIPLPDNTPIPGSFGALDRPTERPDEPVTAGAPFGPGPGPAPVNPPSQDLVGMAKYLPTLEFMANQPDSSEALRNFVRRLRGAMPREAG